MTRTLNLPLALPLSWSGGGSAYAPVQGGVPQPDPGAAILSWDDAAANDNLIQWDDDAGNPQYQQWDI